MIQKIIVKNESDDILELELARPELSGLAVLSASGLEPPEASINVMNLGANDGALFNSARVGTRNITLNLMLMDYCVIDGEYQTIEMLRHKVYKFFQLKRKLTLTVVTDAQSLSTEGYTESCQPAIWSKRETVQVSIVCPDPYFYLSSGMVSTSFASIMPGFGFAFANESLTDPTLLMSRIEHNKYRNIVYKGDIETGIRMILHARGGAVKNISIRDVDQRGSMLINTDKIAEIVGEGFIDKDSIEIDTRTGKKKAILRREGTEYNILNAIDKDSSWHKLYKGNNLFFYSCEEGDSNLYFYIENPVCFGGI